MIDSRWRWISFFCDSESAYRHNAGGGVCDANHNLSDLGVGFDQGLLEQLEAVSQKSYFAEGPQVFDKPPCGTARAHKTRH